ncbi:MAG: prepilin peptidase [Lachnospiraceae bacterium]|nr:prepilin peptidase [Lachnospiraceae bacterium]
MVDIIIGIFIFMYGIVIGSFLNVCILRIPAHESLSKKRSHCMSCGYQLKWYDLFPLFSYLFLGGKCRKCGAHISKQYPIIEAINGVMYVIIVMVNGYNYESVIYCLLFSALLTLSVIDFRTYEIPIGINIFILVLGVIMTIIDYKHWYEHIIGFFAISIFIYIIYYVSDGKAFGGGDVKLMAVAGLVVGWKIVILSFFIGCIVGSIIHVIRMRLSDEGSMLAMGPYLSIGLTIGILFGNSILNWYLSYIM